jgi:hypothetical protein
MNSFCSKCKRELPLRSFCMIKGKVSRICLKCDRERHEEHYLENFNKKVMRLYDGRCVICNGVENLNIVPIETLKLKRRNSRAMVVICDVCKRDGIPSLPRWIRMCSRCKHAWIAKTEITIQCPKCHSSYWHLPKVKK